MPMTAYLDESGTHDGSRLTVMAGWVGYADRWREFDRRWNALLRRPLPYRGSITHIHGKDLRQGSKQFRGWPVEDRRQTAGSVIAACVLRLFIGLLCQLRGTLVSVAHKHFNSRRVGRLDPMGSDNMCAGPRAGMPACIRYRGGKAARCASSCAKPQRPHTSSSRNVRRHCP